jgi:predicted signal transduction protein with EAL and GGDEF domain
LLAISPPVDLHLFLLAVIAASALTSALAVVRYRRAVGSRIASLMQMLSRANDKLDHQAMHDNLTALPTRALFEERLAQALANRAGKTMVVMFIGLDRFKLINDSLGHACGDLVLVAVGQRLVAALPADATVARIGGDEFAVLLPDVADRADGSLGDASGPGHAEGGGEAALALALQRSLAAPFLIGGHEQRLTVSIGVSLHPNDGTDVSSLMVSADLALDHAKKLGRDTCTFFVPSMNRIASDRMELERSLRHAVAHAEFTLHYQPKIALQNGEIIGVEALVRWQHPTRGLVSPGEFIPLAEELGLIAPLGAWVLHQACAQNRAWLDAGLPPVKMAVNLSAAQFRHGNLVKMIADTLTATGLDAGSLELELTESMLMHDAADATLVLQRLHAMGVSLSIDDFGTGYSSLSYLKRFRLDTLKIDRSFVSELGHDVDDAAIVRSIIVLAHSLRLNVIAEGVETIEQLEFLRQMGCDQYQGYYASRPLPVDQFETLLRRSMPARLPAATAAGVLADVGTLRVLARG